MPKKLNIQAGDRFGGWTVLSATRTDGTHILCQCDCGSERLQMPTNIVSGRSKSCGCKRPRQAAVVQTGERFSRLVVISEGEFDEKRKERRFNCQCDCGEKTLVASGMLRSGGIKSCGCNRIVHGLVNTPEYHTYQSMKSRCLNPNHHAWENYGGRGITICDRWLGPNGFAQFYADMGSRPEGHTLDRINNDKGYSPENCRWATWKQQQNNRRPHKKRAK